MALKPWVLRDADPSGPAATALLALAAREIWALYDDPQALTRPTPQDPPLAPGAQHLLAWVDGEAVGGAGLRPLHAGVLELRRVFVRPAWRGRGLADDLVRALLDRARQAGAQAVWLETGERQHAALRLYTRLGFRPIASFADHADDPTSRCLGLRLAVGVSGP